jgi:hypothetical protein
VTLDEPPTVTLLGCRETPDTAGVPAVSLTLALSVAWEVPSVAVTVAVTGDSGLETRAPKRAVFDPEGTVTDPGATSNADWSLARVTAVSTGAGTSRVTRFAV